MILKREMSAGFILSGGFMTSCNAPSMRYRTRNSCSKHSKWMSDAPRSTASLRIPLINLTTGASSTAAASAAAVGSSSLSSSTSRSPSASEISSSSVCIALSDAS